MVNFLPLFLPSVAVDWDIVMSAVAVSCWTLNDAREVSRLVTAAVLCRLPDALAVVRPFFHPRAQFDLAGSARIDVLISVIEPRQASQIVKEITELLPLEQAKVSGNVNVGTGLTRGPGDQLRDPPRPRVTARTCWPVSPCSCTCTNAQGTRGGYRRDK